jgi:hypothetical protein
MTITTAARRIAREHNSYLGTAFSGYLVFDRATGRGGAWYSSDTMMNAETGWGDGSQPGPGRNPGLVVVKIDASRRMTQREAQALLDGVDPDDL